VIYLYVFAAQAAMFEEDGLASVSSINRKRSNRMRYWPWPGLTLVKLPGVA